VSTARDAGYTHLYLESFPAFTEALAMYRDMAFKQIDHPLGNSGHYACNIWMVKKL
jgi:putative acetyltransferase